MKNASKDDYFVDDAIGDEGCRMMGEALKCNSTLVSLNMWGKDEEMKRGKQMHILSL